MKHRNGFSDFRKQFFVLGFQKFIRFGIKIFIRTDDFKLRFAVKLIISRFVKAVFEVEVSAADSLNVVVGRIVRSFKVENNLIIFVVLHDKL